MRVLWGYPGLNSTFTHALFLSFSLAPTIHPPTRPPTHTYLLSLTHCSCQAICLPTQLAGPAPHASIAPLFPDTTRRKRARMRDAMHNVAKTIGYATRCITLQRHSAANITVDNTAHKDSPATVAGPGSTRACPTINNGMIWDGQGKFFV